MSKQKISVLNRVNVFMCLIVLAASGVITASNEVVVAVAEGMSVNRGDLLQARQVAISDALRNAVEQAAGTIVDAKTLVKDFQTLEDSILTKAQGYVSDYKILDTSISGGIYKVRIEATIKKGPLKDDLDAIYFTIKRAGDPRIMVIIPEQHLRRAIPDPAAETEIIRQLLEAGFRILDPKQVRLALESEVLRRALAGDANAYTALGAEYGADLLVIGEAFSEEIGNFQGFVSCRARVEIRVVRADTGEILAAHGEHASGADLTESAASKKSLANAGGKIAKYLIETLPAKLVDLARSVQISVTDITYSDLRKIERHLRETQLVTNVFTREFVGGTARLDVETSLLPVQLVEMIISWQDLALEVIGISGNKIELINKF